MANFIYFNRCGENNKFWRMGHGCSGIKCVTSPRCCFLFVYWYRHEPTKKKKGTYCTCIIRGALGLVASTWWFHQWYAPNQCAWSVFGPLHQAPQRPPRAQLSGEKAELSSFMYFGMFHDGIPIWNRDSIGHIYLPLNECYYVSFYYSFWEPLLWINSQVAQKACR